MGTDNKGMVSLCQFQCKLPADPVRFFRYDLSRLEGLPEMVGNHVIRAPVPARQVRILSFRQKELRIGCPAVAPIAENEFSKICFLWIFHIVNDVRNRRGNIPALPHMQRHQPRGCHTSHPLYPFLRLTAPAPSYVPPCQSRPAARHFYSGSPARTAFFPAPMRMLSLPG